jgi:hypothetical protein
MNMRSYATTFSYHQGIQNSCVMDDYLFIIVVLFMISDCLKKCEEAQCRCLWIFKQAKHISISVDPAFVLRPSCGLERVGINKNDVNERMV